MSDETADTPPLENAIAIVGMSGRFPGAPTVEQFWRNLCAGVESISRFDDAELEDSFSDAVRRAPGYVKARPILPNVDLFDAGFFGMYARETELTDPQQRLFLECAWEALESGGYDPATYPGLIGVFGGCSISTYFLQHVLAERRAAEEFTSSYQVGCYPQLLGAGLDFLTTRVSYKLDLKGPSVTLQTACSTSLLAVAQACQSLLLYQSDMALAGGASITFPQKRGYLHQEGGMVSADGRCRPFDAEASGTIFGSGVGIVLLKRLEDALAARDHVYAVIRGCGVNNDGATKVGFTAPSVSGQAAAIEMAHTSGGIDPRSIGYVECHGTATPLGDPIEVAALTKAFRTGTQERQFCALGSVKSNIGHLDAAAGVVGLIKTALALERGTLPASLHFVSPNPQIDFASTPFYVNSKLTPWPRGSAPRRAGVSAFGVGGTNVHVVLEEAPQLAERASSGSASELLVLSARSETALAAARGNLAEFLRSNPQVNLADIANTLQRGRRVFEHRSFVVACDAAAAATKLDAPVPTQRARPKQSKGSPVAFMFPGQGSQYPDMARGLYATEPEFRLHFERCIEICRPQLGAQLAEIIHPRERTEEAAKSLMATKFAQPAIFTVEYALAKLWMSWGIRPAAMIGHSVGEFVAAVLAGVMSLEDALPLVAMRGRLMQELAGGSMLAVRLPERDLVPLLSPELSIAAVNGPALSVASGPNAAIEALERVLEGRGAMSRRLHTSHAFHSSMVDPIIEPLRARLEQVRLSPSSIPYVSCVTGTWIEDAEATAPHYWARHARETVRFADGIASVVTRFPGAALLEVGAGTVLSTLARQALQGKDVTIVTSLQDSQLEASDRDCILEALGRLWTHGVEPDWSALRTQPARRVPLPTYPFERKRFWIDTPAAQRTAPSLPVAVEKETEMNPQSNNSRVPELSAAIGAILEELSGTAPPSLTDPVNFLEMGYDSLFLTQVAQKIQSQMKVKITFRQLLGEYSTIALLAAHLADKMPAPAQRAAAAPGAAVVPAAGVTASSAASAAVTAALQGAVAAPLVAAGGLEGLFRDQLQTLSQLMNKQLELLQGAGASIGIPVAATPVAARSAGATSDTARSIPSASAPDTSATEQRPSRFTVYNPKQTTPDRNITPEHQRHIDDLAARYSRRMEGSKRLTQQYRRPLADPRAASGFRNEWKEMVFPIVVERASGSKLWDVDGNELVDLVNGYGQTCFGHSPDFVVEAVKAQLDHGFAIGPQAQLAGKVAELFSEMTGNERVTFCNTGSEAVMAAMRVARTVTGREKIVIFNGDYHGQFDEVLVKGVQRAGAPPRSMPVAPGIPASAVQNMIVLDYATPATLQWVRENAEDLAAVVVEPVQSRHPSLQPYEFLREIRKITEESGTAFVMDEVVTGFRTHQGGIQALAGISADMATYGKVVGGGLPIGILAGKSKFMDALDGGHWNFGDTSFPETGVTFFAGTFVRHPLVLAAAWAVLQHLKAQGPQLQERLAQRTTALASDLNQLFARYGIKARIETFSSWFYFNIHDEHPLAALLFQHLRLRGVHIHDGFPCFLTTAHSDADIKRIYDAFSDSVEELHSVGILGNKPRSAAGGQGGAPTGLPLTENQTEIWLAAQMGDQASCAFNESVSIRMRGALHETALRDALTYLFDRHDALRASFTPTGEEMRIAESRPADLPVVDLAGSADAEKTLAKVIDQDARTPFDLVNGPLARVQLLRAAPDDHVLLFTAHHIICDGWSINVIISELAEVYPLLCRGERPQLAPALPFSSYARMQAQRDPEEARKTETFWLEQFRDPVKPLDLPTDRPRDVLKSYAGSSRCHRIEAVLYRALKQSGAKAGNTLFVTLLGAFQALIGRLCGQNEVVVGVPTAGQSLLEEQILVGHCVNFLPIRGAWSDATSIAEHLRTVAKRVLDSYEHQGYTLGTLVRKLDMARQQNRVPLTEIQFNLERLADRIELPGLELDVAPNAKAAVNFDLFLNVIESNDGLRLDCDYNTDLFDAATIDRWLDCYRTLLEAIVADTSQPLVKAPYVPAAERQQLIVDFNRTAADFPRDRCVHHLFEMRAAEQPAAAAVQFLDASMSYDALNRRANQLANHLRRRLGNDLGRPRLVGVAVDRTFDMLVALLATMKAGCAYVPLDPAHPPTRLRHILTDAAVTAVIVDGSADPHLAPAGTAVINLQSEAREIAGMADTAPAVPVSAESAAYVIYTSGSTGQPKGVAVSHAAVVNFLTSMAREPGLTAQDVLLAVTTISFDIAALELYLPLVTGARVVIADREEAKDGFALLRRLDQCGATVMQATPAGWRVLLEAGFQPKPGFKMLCGGEALPRELANRLLEGGGVLWNMYGPTETTIWSSCCPVNPGDAPIGVGKPIANTQLYVLDGNDRPVAIGVPGQLHIGGDGVALGYHERPELTAEKFVDNPFTRGRMYRTGDLARWLPDGRLQVLGRIDHQIKLRGYRIELGEIEAALAEKAQLQAVAVVLREDVPGSPRLVAYYVAERASMHSSKELAELLAQEVPDYMIPSAWVRLDALPVSPNGKLDRAALPRPDAGQQVEDDYRAPTTPTELTLAGICTEVLNLARISVDADLLRLGADSLQLFQITARANRTGLHFSVKQLLQQRTLAQVAHWLDSSDRDLRRPETGVELPSLGQFKRGRRSSSNNS